MPTLDSAIHHALSLPPSTPYTLIPHGGSSFTTTSKLTLQTTPPRTYFLKTSHSPDAAIMLTGEFASLLALSSFDRTLTAAPIAHGPLADSPGHYLLTEFLAITSQPRTGEHTLAKKLARLHTRPAGDGMFGFEVANCCGGTLQENTPCASWVEFFGARRMGGILAACEAAGVGDAEIRRLGERVRGEVVPRLLGAVEGVVPVLCHGDLWSGNKGRAVVGGVVEEVVWDACAVWAHREYEHGIMEMFGGFGGGFWEEYWKEVGGVEKPVEEGGARRKLYKLYHQLNHAALFGGGGYKEEARESMKWLVDRYGEGGKLA